MLSLLLAATLAAAPVDVRLVPREARPSLLAPVAMVSGGAVISLGGTALTLFGVSMASIRTSCVAGADCQGNVYRVAGALIGSGVLLIAGGIVMAIVGHVHRATREE